MTSLAFNGWWLEWALIVTSSCKQTLPRSGNRAWLHSPVRVWMVRKTKTKRRPKDDQKQAENVEFPPPCPIFRPWSCPYLRRGFSRRTGGLLVLIEAKRIPKVG